LDYCLSSAIAHGGGDYEEIGAVSQRDPEFVDRFSDDEEDVNFYEDEEEDEITEDVENAEEDENQDVSSQSENCEEEQAEQEHTGASSPPLNEGEDKGDQTLDSTNGSRISTIPLALTDLIVRYVPTITVPKCAPLPFTPTERLAVLAKIKDQRVNGKRKWGSLTSCDKYVVQEKMSHKRRTEFLDSCTEVTEPELIKELGPDLSDLPDALYRRRMPSPPSEEPEESESVGESEDDHEQSDEDQEAPECERKEPAADLEYSLEDDDSPTRWAIDETYMVNVRGPQSDRHHHIWRDHYDQLAPGQLNANPQPPTDPICTFVTRRDLSGFYVVVLTYTRNRSTRHLRTLEKMMPELP
jgi:hypothetical protein